MLPAIIKHNARVLCTLHGHIAAGGINTEVSGAAFIIALLVREADDVTLSQVTGQSGQAAPGARMAKRKKGLDGDNDAPSSMFILKASNPIRWASVTLKWKLDLDLGLLLIFIMSIKCPWSLLLLLHNYLAHN